MRIAIWYNLPSGGGKRALHDHVRGLLALGHEVEAWAPPTRDGTYLPLDQIIPEHILPIELPDGQTLSERFGLRAQSRRMLANVDRHCRLCAEQINAGGFDVLFANSCYLTASSPIGRHVTIPSVLYLQEPYRSLHEAVPRMMWSAPEDKPFGLRAIKQMLVDRRDVQSARIQVREEVRSARAFGRILCNSYFSRESILRAYGLRARVCYLGIDPSRFTNYDGDRDPIIIALGSLSSNKGQRETLDAIAKMKSFKPRLLWIGNSAEPTTMSAMRSYAAELEIDLDIRIRVSDDDLTSLLQKAAVLLYTPRLEPFGFAPLEANACGTPVVATAEGGVRETVINGVNGILVEPDPDDIAEGLDRLFANPEDARQMGKAGRELSLSRWSLEAGVHRLESELLAEIAADAEA